jgi:hypothetical protein
VEQAFQACAQPAPPNWASAPEVVALDAGLDNRDAIPVEALGLVRDHP